MVKWINAQSYESPISGAIERAAASLWGDTLTPSLKREQLLKAQRENAGAQNMMGLFRDLGGASAGYARPAAPVATAPAGPRAPAGRMSGPLPNGDANPLVGPTRYRAGMLDTANAIGMDPVDLATIISYETAGTFDPAKAGPTTQWGQHRGLIQFGEPQAAKYGVDWSNPADSQLGPNGAIAQYFLDNGWQPGMGLMDAYSIVNAGAPGRYNASDAANGGAPGTVADKVNNQMSGHRANAEMLFGGYLPPATPSGMDGAPATGGEYNPRNPGQFYGELAARAAESGMDPANAAELARMFMAGTFGAENQATTDAFVGAGGDYGKTYSGFSADQNRMERDSVRDATVDMRGQDVSAATSRANNADDVVNVIRDGVAVPILKRDMQPTDQVILSDSEQKARAAARIGMSREEQLAYVGAEPKNPPQADSYVTADGRVHRSYDGVNDVNGVPLPPDALKTSVTAASRDDTGLTKPVQTGVQNQMIGLDNLESMLGEARSVAAADPTLFGVVGAARTAGQNLMQQWQQFSQVAPQEAGRLEQQNQSMIDSIMAAEDPDGLVAQFLSSEYDPNLSALDLYGRLLPYAAAAALAQQEGRGLSNQDVTTFKGIVGDPTALFSTQAGFLTRLDLLDKMVKTRKARAAETLGGGVTVLQSPPPEADVAAPPPETSAPATAPAISDAPQINTDAEYDALPSGTEFIAPDGSRRRKP